MKKKIVIFVIMFLILTSVGLFLFLSKKDNLVSRKSQSIQKFEPPEREFIIVKGINFKYPFEISLPKSTTIEAAAIYLNLDQNFDFDSLYIKTSGKKFVKADPTATLTKDTTLKLV